MKAFIINLKKDSLRRTKIAKLLSNCCFDYEFLEGVNGKDLDVSQLDKLYDSEKTKKLLGVEMTVGEIGCALSHLKAYQKIMDDGLSSALIFEDDMCPKSSLNTAIQEISEYNPVKPQVILLSPAGLYYSNGLKISNEHQIHETYNAWRAHAYYINRAAASALLKILTPVHQVADNWDWISKQDCVQVNCLVPPCADHQTGETMSNIDAERHILHAQNNKSFSWVHLIKKALIKIKNRALLSLKIIKRG